MEYKYIHVEKGYRVAWSIQWNVHVHGVRRTMEHWRNNATKTDKTIDFQYRNCFYNQIYKLCMYDLRGVCVFVDKCVML